MKRWKWIVTFFLIAVISFLIWQEFKIQPGFEQKSNKDETVAIISYYTAIAGAFAGFFGLLKEIIAVFRERKNDT